MVAVGADVGAEPLQLLDVAEAARVEVLGDDADAVGDRQHGDDQRLVVGGDAGIRQRGDVDRSQPLGGRRPRRPSTAAGRSRGPCRGSGAAPSPCARGRALTQHDLAAGDGARGDVGGGLDAVGDRLVGSGSERARLDTVDHADATCRCPRCRAPIVTRKSHRSMISGSRAALSIVVSPRLARPR